jgi:phosphatidate cytidylyltransferase
MNQELFKRVISSITLLPITLFFIIKGSFLFNFFILIFFFISTFEWNMMVKKPLYKIFGFIFLILSFYTIYKIRNDFPSDYYFFLLVLLTCISTDVGGYIFGNIFKGPKLTKISPKKTYSGMMGGYLLSIIFINFFLNNSFNNSSIEFTGDTFVLVILISTVSQIGDIIISYFKRLSNIKDTGKIIPGHGGLLDRIDGMIFAFPFSYLFFINWYY